MDVWESDDSITIAKARLEVKLESEKNEYSGQVLENPESLLPLLQPDQGQSDIFQENLRNGIIMVPDFAFGRKPGETFVDG